MHDPLTAVDAAQPPWFDARTMTDHTVLFIPGPVEVDPELRAIMAQPLIGHRDPAFVAEVQAVCGKLQRLFRTEAPTLFENAPGTALMEAGIRNLVSRGGRVLHLTCGAFSERWHKISGALGRQPHALAVEWGHAHTPDALRQCLEEHGPFEAVCITHNETSTGVMEPLAELAAAVRATAPDTLILVDSVTSLAGAPLEFDGWGLDLAFAGTQKCLALPPGLCVFAVSQRAMERALTVEERGYLLDFHVAHAGMAAGRTVATPCVPLVFALSAQLDRILDRESLEGRWGRHVALRDQTLAWAGERGFEPFPVDPSRCSPTVTCLRASGRDVAALADRALAAGFKMDKGYGKLKGEAFRIGHMGDHSAATLGSFLTALSE